MKSTPCKPPDKLITAEEFMEKYAHLSGIELVDGRIVWAGSEKPICEQCLKNAIPEPEEPDEKTNWLNEPNF